MDAIDREVLAALAGDVLNPALAEEIVLAARDLFEASDNAEAGDALRQELAHVVREQARLTDAIAAGADAPVLVDRLKTTERRRRELSAAVEAHQRTRQAPAWDEIERRIRQSLTDWRSLLSGDVAQARGGFRELLRTPILFTPFVEDGRRGIRFEGRVGLDALLAGEVTKMASPTGNAIGCKRDFSGIAV